MATLINDPDRKTVPRWRPWQDAISLGETDVFKKVRTLEKPNLDDLMKTKASWEANRSVAYAADFIGAAYAIGYGHLAREAAEFILTTSSKTSPEAHAVAYQIIHGPQRPLHEPAKIDEDTSRQNINKIRASLRAYPRNPLAYMDLAREYVGKGQASRAERPIEIALALAPNNRFVLRSASRFFLHRDDHDRAHHILRAAERVKADPWILAAEIAVAGAAERTSSLIKIGRQLLESKNISPFHTSELASALGTLECEAGNSKLGKRLLQQALREPTDNAVAQASWISRRIRGFQIDPQSLQTPRSYEARAWENMFNGNWMQGVTEADLWLRDESFSSRPAVFASWAATSSLTQYKQAENFARQGLKTHPNDFLLLNNLAVALANMDRTEEAENELNKTIQTDLENEYKPTFLATRGLIQFRRDLPGEGRILYRMAINVAKEAKQYRSTVWALLHYAREEYRFDALKAEQIIKEALDELPKLEEPQQQLSLHLYERILNEVRSLAC